MAKTIYNPLLKKGFQQVETSSGGTTNLSLGVVTATTVEIDSDTGTDVTIPAATITEAGVLTAADKVKLNNTSGTNTGDQTNITGNAATVTTNANLTGPVTSVGNATTITNGVVTNAKLAQKTAPIFLARNTAGLGDIEDVTPTQATAMLNTFTGALKGLVPNSSGGTTTYLRADQLWVRPEVFHTTLTTAVLGTDQHNFTMTGFGRDTMIRFQLSADINLTGLSVAALISGRSLLCILNVSAFNLTIVNNSGSSLANNRFLLPVSLANPTGDIVIPPDGAVIIIRDNTVTKFRVFNL